MNYFAMLMDHVNYLAYIVAFHKNEISKKIEDRIQKI